jgi:hypothetical protein
VGTKGIWIYELGTEHLKQEYLMEGGMFELAFTLKLMGVIVNVMKVLQR